jgi:hypothetical protein
MSTRLERRVIAKTADYTVSLARDRSGSVFTNRGAGGTVVFTLPPASAAAKGYTYEFRGVADYAITVASAVADTLVALNDAAADSVSASTASGLIGARIDAFCDGTQWFANVVAIGVTQTIATA